MTFKSLLFLLALLLSFSTAKSVHAEDQNQISLVPWPKTLMMKQGLLRLTGHSHIVAKSQALEPLARLLSEEILLVTGVRLAPSTKERSEGDLVLEITPELKAEAYTLDV